MVMAAPAGRVRANTSVDDNDSIDRRARMSVAYYAAAPHEIDARLQELDREWDVERVLEANASTLALSGILLGIGVSRKFLVIPALVAAFLLQHAVQGWCPPLPLLRRLGVRTRREIDAEKYALKALRGDFDRVDQRDPPSARAAQALAGAAGDQRTNHRAPLRRPVGRRGRRE
ncbi:MAG: hypothetical protein GIKADHBN_00233 [Phycisphaerales bacterium]|nr:hypothetical protein [Phycisphaerales bacterium]